MGCWAIGSFGNDDAADWLSGLTEQDDLALVRETISQLLAADGYLMQPRRWRLSRWSLRHWAGPPLLRKPKKT